MQPKTLTTFLNELKTKGIRKQNQFQLVVTSGHGDIDAALENITMWANTASLPNRSQEFIDVHYQAYPFKVPSRLAMTQETTLTIKCDADGEMRRAFLKWMSHISNPAISDGSAGEGDKKIPSGSNVRFLFYNDNMDSPVEIYKLVGCAPSEVGALEMTNEDATITTFDVVLTYQYWELEEASAGAITDIR